MDQKLNLKLTAKCRPPFKKINGSISGHTSCPEISKVLRDLARLVCLDVWIWCVLYYCCSFFYSRWLKAQWRPKKTLTHGTSNHSCLKRRLLDSSREARDNAAGQQQMFYNYFLFLDEGWLVAVLLLRSFIPLHTFLYFLLVIWCLYVKGMHTNHKLPHFSWNKLNIWLWILLYIYHVGI